MKNLVAKAGVAAIASALMITVPLPQEASALELTASTVGSIAFGSPDGVASPESAILLINNDPFQSAGAVEVGEYLYNQTRAYAEYDLSSINAGVPNFYSPDYQITLGFNVFSKGGTGSGGTPGLGSNLDQAFNGNIQVFWYTASTVEALAGTTNPLSVFTPEPPLFFLDPYLPVGGEQNGGTDLFDPLNPLYTIDMSTKNEGDRITIDVTNLVKNLLASSTTSKNFLGLMFKMDPNSTQLAGGSCGTNRQCVGTTLNNFDLGVVPTPAAILPSLIGLGAAAFRKKRNEIDDLTSEVES